MEENPPKVEYEQAEHDNAIHKEELEQQQQSPVRVQVKLSPLQNQDSLVPQSLVQQFQNA